jgi:multicomponent K+:H+ antiporter subunit E
VTARWLPYPLLAASLLAMWLLLNGLSVEHLIFGSIVAVLASWAMVALQPAKPRVKRWDIVLRLLIAFLDDVLRSNIAVAAIILFGRNAGPTSGFVVIPLELRDPTALAALACIITSTPGTVWVDYSPASGNLTIHVLDLQNEQAWIDRIKQRYERLLLEIFA